jgi:protein-tyrosine phosphatase
MTVTVLFVCLGNYCRSPMAEALFRHRVAEANLQDQIQVDSAGLGPWQVGNPPHEGTQLVLRRHGIPMGNLLGRQVETGDFQAADYLIAMDQENLMDLRRLAQRHGQDASHIVRLLDFADPAVTGGLASVPDPYFDGNFDQVYHLIESGCAGLLAHIRQVHGL